MTENMNTDTERGPDPAIADARFAAEAELGGGQAVQERDVDRLQRELEEAREAAEAANDKFLRARADMDNFKKRIERSYADQTRAAKKDLLRKLLGVKDNIERALQYGESRQGTEGIMEGVRLTLFQLEQLLQGEGVKQMSPEGNLFNPHFEEAIQRVDDPSVPDQTVVQVARPGYSYLNPGSREEEVLRPAQVIVSVHGADGE